MFIDTTNLLPAKQHFNSSIAEFNNEIYFAYRYETDQLSRVAICKMDKDYKPIEGTNTTLLIPHPHKNSLNKREDPRLFVFHGKLHCSFINFSPIYCKANQGLCSLDENLKVDHIWYPNYGFNHNNAIIKTKRCYNEQGAFIEYRPRNGIEKNWTFFEHKTKLYGVYHIEPHEIILIKERNKPKLISKIKNNIIWDYGQLRGGTPPIQVGDEYFSFFHSSKRENNVLIYHMGVYAFKARPPFKITRISKIPLLSGDLLDEKRPPHLAVVFPCGVIFKDNKWTISYGYNDYASKLITFTHEEVLSNCKTV